MRAFIHLVAKDDVEVAMRAVEPLQALASAAILLGIALVVLISIEAISAPLAGWASAQTFASLAPV